MNQGRPILTSASMRDAEERAIAAGTPIEALMERAGLALAEAALRFAGPMPALVLVGPGNNGGDGFVAARHLAQRGIDVRVAAPGAPRSDGCLWARKEWQGPVETLDEMTAPAPLLIDALFGTGLKRGLEVSEEQAFARLACASTLVVACDLPSGVESDTGALLSDVPRCDLTVTFGALKPAHRLFPAINRCGRVVLADIGILATGQWHEIARPDLPAIDPGGHKYDRGLVHCLAGTMPGAIALAATAAARSGAGYVRVSTSKAIEGLPSSVVQTGTADLHDQRIGCVLVGPGLGELPQLLTLALTSKAPKVIDADAIKLIGDPARLKGHDVILTPHGGEFDALFGSSGGTKAERVLAAAKACANVVVFKGPDTLVAAPDGRLAFAPPAPAWLASAGTGDVLAGIIAALRARGMASFEAASAGVWLHGRAAEAAGPNMIADDLAAAISIALND